MPDIQNQLKAVQGRIAAASRPTDLNQPDVTLIAVSKTKPISDLREALACGVGAFGENYVQECVEKVDTLGRDAAEWHFIGPLQSNKTKLIAERVDWVHSIDRLKIAERLSTQRPATLAPINLCIQVNIDREPQKAGVMPEDVLELANAVAQLPRARLRGLMAIPAAGGNSEQAFSAMAKLKLDLENAGHSLDTLSMGMTSDFELAIKHGATHVRVGTAIFGARN